MCPYCRSVQARASPEPKVYGSSVKPGTASNGSAVLYNTVGAHGSGYLRPDSSQHTEEVLTPAYVQAWVRYQDVGDGLPSAWTSIT